MFFKQEFRVITKDGVIFLKTTSPTVKFSVMNTTNSVNWPISYLHFGQIYGRCLLKAINIPEPKKLYLQQQSNILKIQAESVVPSRCRRHLRRAATFRRSSVRIPEPEMNSWIRRDNNFSALFVATPGFNFLIWHLKRKFVYVQGTLNNHKST